MSFESSQCLAIEKPAELNPINFDAWRVGGGVAFRW
jgi:hypothetical protein